MLHATRSVPLAPEREHGDYRGQIWCSQCTQERRRVIPSPQCCPSSLQQPRVQLRVFSSKMAFGAVAGKDGGPRGVAPSPGPRCARARPGSAARPQQRRGSWLRAIRGYKRSLPRISAFDLNNPNKGRKQPKPTDFFKASI